MTLVTIYALADPLTFHVCYVGKTKHSAQSRLKGHLSDARRRGNRIRRFAWINQLAARGLVPLVVVLERVAEADWQAAEQMWVTEMRGRFPELLNATAGGDGIHDFQHSPETRAKQSAAATARYANRPPKVKPPRKSLKGRVFSDEHRLRISLAMTGKTRSIESCLSQSLSRTGMKHSPETREKIRLAALARKR